MLYELLWPERRRVTAQQIALWHSDAIANGDIAYEGDYSTPAEDDYDTMARELHEAGLITLKAVPL